MKRGDSISVIFVLNNIDSFNVHGRKNVYSFRQRIKESDNLLLKAVVSSVFYKNQSSLTKRWDDKVYTFNT